MASKYSPLADHLRQQSGPRHTMSFADIETLIGDRLPPSSRNPKSAWWGNVRSPNSRRPQATDGWVAVGWEVESVDQARETVTFRK